MNQLFVKLLVGLFLLSAMTESALAQNSGRQYRLDSGDILAVIVHGILGDFNSAPIHLPKNGSDIIAGIGHPVPVRDNGTLDLPLIDPVNVRGMTVIEAEDAVEKAYFDADILSGKNLVTVNMMRKRTIQVMVVHDSSPHAFRGESARSVTKVNVPADSASTLSALAESGGYFDANNVRIIRQNQNRNRDARLSDGDIVSARSSDTEYFHAGGLLNGGRYSLPQRSTINAAQAIAQAGGRIGGSGFGPSELLVTRGSRTMRYDVNWLLANPSAVTIRPGDTITLRQTNGDRIGNAGRDILRLRGIR